LTAGLADPDRSVRQAAALALGERFEAARADSLAPPPPELAAAPAKLVAVLGDASAGVRLAVARSLGRAGPLATADLARPITEGGDSFRAGLLIDALGAGGDPRAVPVVTAMPSTSMNVVIASHVDVALARLGWMETRGALPVDSRAEAAVLREGVIAYGAEMRGGPPPSPAAEARIRAAQLLEDDARTRAAGFRGQSGSAPAP
jgi:HEAT repeat protein